MEEGKGVTMLYLRRRWALKLCVERKPLRDCPASLGWPNQTMEKAVVKWAYRHFSWWQEALW